MKEKFIKNRVKIVSIICLIATVILIFTHLFWAFIKVRQHGYGIIIENIFIYYEKMPEKTGYLYIYKTCYFFIGLLILFITLSLLKKKASLKEFFNKSYISNTNYIFDIEYGIYFLFLIISMFFC
jgi:hypothetical protein